MAQVKDLLTIPETAERLRISVRSVRRLIDEGKLPTHRFSARMVRIHTLDISDYLSSIRDEGEAS
jgi:excisionase family DNA binding protein